MIVRLAVGRPRSARAAVRAGPRSARAAVRAGPRSARAKPLIRNTQIKLKPKKSLQTWSDDHGDPKFVISDIFYLYIDYKIKTFENIFLSPKTALFVEKGLKRPFLTQLNCGKK